MSKAKTRTGLVRIEDIIHSFVFIYETMLNDCTAPAEIQKYLTGIKEFKQGVKDLYNTSFKKLDTEKQIELFSENYIKLKILLYFLIILKS